VDASEGRVLTDELRTSIDRALSKSLIEIRRDLQIELDLALVTQAPAAVVVDEAFRDQLVPLQNRRGLEQGYGALPKEADEPFCVVQFDLDRFKRVNDEHGHDIGNEALLSIAKTAMGVVKGKGQAFRLHGDEFVLLLPNHTLQEGLAVAERFRREINCSPRTYRRRLESVLPLGRPINGSDINTMGYAGDLAESSKLI
jgi:diguanylate cyclase (GGDEF)-like protein